MQPQGDSQTWPQPAPPSTRRRRKFLPGGFLGLALVLIAGLLARSMAARTPTASPVPASSTAPFAVALDYLAASPEVSYQSTVSGLGAVDVTVTDHNELVGSVSIGGQSYRLLRVAGALYVKAPAAGLPATNDSAKTATLAGRWVTGQDVRDMLGSSLLQYVSPSALAQELRSALGSEVPFAPSMKVDGINALAASTPDGVLYVSQQLPYRVVRLAPAGTASALGGTSSSANAQAAAFLTSAASAASALSGTDFSSGNSNDLASTYKSLEDDTGALSSAVDSDLSFNVQGDGQLSCGDGGCEVTVTVSNTVSLDASGATIISGQVLADLEATIEVGGEPAGGCTGSGELPLNGTGELSCDDAGAGAVFASVDAQKKAQAEAQSAAEGGVQVPYEVDSTGEYYVYATAQVDVAKQVAAEKQEAADDQDANLCDGSGAAGDVAGSSFNGALAPSLIRAHYIFAAGSGGSAPVQKGQQGVALLIRNLGARGFSPSQMWKEVSVVAANGVPIRFDLVAEKDGAYYFFDAKNGPSAGFTTNQGSRGGYASVETGGGRFYGPNAAKPNAAGTRLPSSFGPSPVYIQGFGGSPYC